MSINPITLSETAYTSNGAKYEKTSAGKKIGTAVGLGTAVANAIKNKNATILFYKKAKPYIKKPALVATIAAVLAISTTLRGLIGRGIGAVADKIANKSRQKEADVKMIADTVKGIDTKLNTTQA